MAGGEGGGSDFFKKKKDLNVLGPREVYRR